MRYLLDTNIISHMIRHPDGMATEQARLVEPAALCTSIIVAAELRFGVAKKGLPALTARVSSALEMLDILPFEAPADEFYAQSRARLEGMGQPIGANDMLIAAQCLALDYILVTDNEREFAHIEGLRVENWLRG